MFNNEYIINFWKIAFVFRYVFGLSLKLYTSTLLDKNNTLIDYLIDYIMEK